MAVTAREQLEQFRRLRTQQVLVIDGAEWTYFDSGGKGPTHVLLHGGLGDGESLFPIFEPLAARARVIAPSVPAEVETASSAASGLVSIVETLAHGPVHVFGHSQGGYLAQVLVRSVPDRVASLVLSATCPPSPARARKLALQLGLVGLLPEIAIRAAAVAELRRLVSSELRSLRPSDRAFWSDYLTRSVLAKGLKRRAAGSAGLQLDYHRNAHFSSGDMGRWRGRTLILSYGRDPLMGAETWRALTDLYPGADLRFFPEAGHLSPFLRPAPIVDLLTELSGPYLDGRSPLAPGP